MAMIIMFFNVFKHTELFILALFAPKNTLADVIRVLVLQFTIQVEAMARAVSAFELTHGASRLLISDVFWHLTVM